MRKNLGADNIGEDISDRKSEKRDHSEDHWRRSCLKREVPDSEIRKHDDHDTRENSYDESSEEDHENADCIVFRRAEELFWSEFIDVFEGRHKRV